MLKYTLLLLLIIQAPVFSQTRLVVLGIAQDAGYPHIGCERECCENISQKRLVSSIGLLEAETGRSWLMDATPDITAQTKILQTYTGKRLPDGIFLTHAHIGHYTGLMYLGREAAGAKKTPVYAMPQLKAFLETNGP